MMNKHTIEELEELIERQKYIDKTYTPILVNEKTRKLFLEHGQNVIEHLEKQITKLKPLTEEEKRQKYYDDLISEMIEIYTKEKGGE